VWGYDPPRRTFYARLRLAACIRDLGSGDEPIGTIDELVDQLTDVTGASWNEVEAWMDTTLGQEGYAPAFFEGWPIGRAYSPTAGGGHTSPGLAPADDSLTQEDIEAARDQVRAYAEQLTDAAHAHAPRRAHDGP
jgi:hypothetical protein